MSVDERRAAIFSLHDEGLSNAEIGRRLGVTRERIRQLLIRKPCSAMRMNLLSDGVIACSKHVRDRSRASPHQLAVHVSESGAMYVSRATDDVDRPIEWLVGRYTPAALRKDPEMVAEDLAARLVELRSGK